MNEFDSTSQARTWLKTKYVDPKSACTSGLVLSNVVLYEDVVFLGFSNGVFTCAARAAAGEGEARVYETSFSGACAWKSLEWAEELGLLPAGAASVLQQKDQAQAKKDQEERDYLYYKSLHNRFAERLAKEESNEPN